MAFEKEVEYSGENKIDTLNSRVRIEQAKNRIIITDGTLNRMLIGMHDGEIIIAVSKDGEDVIEALDA